MMSGLKIVAAQMARKPGTAAGAIGTVFGKQAVVSGVVITLRSRRLTTGSGIAGEGKPRQSGSGGDELQRELTPEEVLRIGARTQEMWRDHVALTTRFPDASHPPGGDASLVSRDVVRRKRLVYRSKQRGWLEVDLLLGTWAERNVAGLSVADMDSYEDILNLETVDIFNYITGNADPPAFVTTPMMARLQAYVKSNPLGRSPASYASAKREANLT